MLPGTLISQASRTHSAREYRDFIIAICAFAKFVTFGYVRWLRIFRKSRDKSPQIRRDLAGREERSNVRRGQAYNVSSAIIIDRIVKCQASTSSRVEKRKYEQECVNASGEMTILCIPSEIN